MSENVRQDREPYAEFEGVEFTEGRLYYLLCAIGFAFVWLSALPMVVGDWLHGLKGRRDD